MSTASQCLPTSAASTASADETQAWTLLRSLAQAATHGLSVAKRSGLRVDAAGRVQHAPEHEAWIVARPELNTCWSPIQSLAASATKLLDLYMPLCIGARSDRLVVAHLGQSADGHVATFCGTSKFITGQDDIRHTHRLRALFDVVLVGASTVAIDDPLLTTRLVPGRTPVRVVLDPQSRLPMHHAVFRDRSARTLLVVDATHRNQAARQVESISVRRQGSGFDLSELLSRLAQRGLRRIFIEGGGVTVGHFLESQLLDRLQIAVAPVVLGAGPNPIATNLTPSALQRFSKRVRRCALGDDVLFDGELTPKRA